MNKLTSNGTSPRLTPAAPAAHDCHDDVDDHDDFGGLTRDLPGLVGRRRALWMLGGVSLAGVVAACGSSGSGSSASASASSAAHTASATALDTATASASASASAGAEIPDETGGPFPADGTNGPNVLTEDGIVRADLKTSIGSLSGTAEGVPMSINLTVVDAATGSAVAGAAVYLWHCTADGKYSIYEVTDQNYLRGVQVTDDAGRLTFQTIFPGCYNGRWPHCHFEVYSSTDATGGNQAVKTSQLALPEADCQVVYADGRYGSSADSLAQQTLASDNVFSDGWTDQLATVTGSVADGYAASLLIRI